jgi:hypothetical protein
MQMILKDVFLILLCAAAWAFSTGLKAGEPDGEMTAEDYRAAAEFGYSNRAEMKAAHRQAKMRISPKQHHDAVARAFGAKDTFEAAEMADEAIQNLIERADGVLRARGEMETADEISLEYTVYYRGAVTCMVAGCAKEIGDHPPLNEWLDGVHEKIHTKLGDYWCQFFHLHDLEILNHGLPVVFNASKYELDDYKDHFAGHMSGAFTWVHHGVAGVVTFWSVQAACSGATAGLGAAAFFCGPIAGFAEHVMDKRIAPPLADRVWKRAHQ